MKKSLVFDIDGCILDEEYNFTLPKDNLKKSSTEKNTFTN